MLKIFSTLIHLVPASSTRTPKMYHLQIFVVSQTYLPTPTPNATSLPLICEQFCNRLFIYHLLLTTLTLVLLEHITLLISCITVFGLNRAWLVSTLNERMTFVWLCLATLTGAKSIQGIFWIYFSVDNGRNEIGKKSKVGESIWLRHEQKTEKNRSNAIWTEGFVQKGYRNH